MHRKNFAAAAAVAGIFFVRISLHGIFGRDVASITRLQPSASDAVLRGRDAFGDATVDRPGLRRLITAAICLRLTPQPPPRMARA